jgi:lipopolysaccharide transport system permease protein
LEKEHWTETITPNSGIFELRLKELWRYRDLILLFVRRDFIATYKQTILGPLWFFIQPIFTTLVFTLVFGKIGKMGPEGVPVFLYYMSGIILWTYFSDCFLKTSSTFIDNQNLFGKVYFPRLTVPLSIVISNLIKFGIQMVLFLVLWIIQ